MRILVFLGFVFSVLYASSALSESAKPKRLSSAVAFFNTRIEPILKQHCYKCHSANSKDVQGGLWLDSRSGLRKGGESGPAVVPGNVEKSLLIDALEHTTLKMPPGKKLPGNVIADFRRWVRYGATDPRDPKKPKKTGPPMNSTTRRNRVLTSVFAAVSACMCSATLCAADAGLPSAQNTVMSETLKLAKRSDVSEAITYLEEQGNDKQIAANYSEIVRNLYFKEKDVPRMILFARAGIGFCLSRAKQLRNTDKESARVFAGTAKTIAYNLGANTWPGWQDKGITIGATDLVVGLDAAKTNLRLGLQLKRADSIIGNAYWLVGAQQLATGEFDKSIKSFQSAKERFRKAKKTEYVLMADGYKALAAAAKQPNDANHAKQFDAAIAKLVELQSNEGKSFVKQLKSVRPMFVRNQR